MGKGTAGFDGYLGKSDFDNINEFRRGDLQNNRVIKKSWTKYPTLFC